VRQLLSKEANSSPIQDSSLSDTLKELFSTFFPGKEFLGPQPTADGRLLFPVRTARGEHDIDELSSGEKEVLYGYLRLRNAAPRNSVLLIDEPELHLNPRLVSGLASFYHRHLGKPLGTQLWLVTHSDTFIREAVGQDGFSVFHMQPPSRDDNQNQASPVQVAQDLDRLVIELVGDLAAYRPGAKIVVFEGDGESEPGFDVRMTCTLFPEFQSKVNAISGGSRRRVEQLYSLLEDARSAGHLPGRFYAITDADSGGSSSPDKPTIFSWDVYHIENYLVEPSFILRVLRDLNRASGEVSDEAKVAGALKKCAEATLDQAVAHRLRVQVNGELIACINLKFDPARKDVAAAMKQALDRSSSRLNAALSTGLSEEALLRQEGDIRASMIQDLRTDQWMRSFRGRDVLRRFVAEHGGGMAYEPFRDLIIARMRDADYQPAGMRRVVAAILEGNDRPSKAGAASSS
jgi:hypothetical protein